MKTRVITIQQAGSASDRDADRTGTAGLRTGTAGLPVSVAHQAAEVLDSGGLVAFPTETVYGVGARADCVEAVERLRKLKSRSIEKPFTVHISSGDAAGEFASPLSGVARRLMRKAWPGPLTLILPVDDPMAQSRMAGLDASAVAAMYFDNTIGLRCPSDAFVHAMLVAAAGPVVAASANRTKRPPPHSADEALAELDGKIDLLIDGGPTRYAQPSTIVRITGSTHEIVREGVYDARIVAGFAAFRVLFVCTGNTCRSPMAGAIAGDMLAKKLGCSSSDRQSRLAGWQSRLAGLSSRGVEISSAGTAGGSGRAAVHAVTVMAQRGIDISNHRSTALAADMIRDADEILVMTGSHRQAVVDMVPSAEQRVRLVLGNRDLDDPIGGSQQDYEQCAQALTQGISDRLDEVVI